MPLEVVIAYRDVEAVAATILHLDPLNQPLYNHLPSGVCEVHLTLVDHIGKQFFACLYHRVSLCVWRRQARGLATTLRGGEQAHHRTDRVVCSCVFSSRP